MTFMPHTQLARSIFGWGMIVIRNFDKIENHTQIIPAKTRNKQQMTKAVKETHLKKTPKKPRESQISINNIHIKI